MRGGFLLEKQLNINDATRLNFIRAVSRDRSLTYGQKIIATTLALEADRTTGIAKITRRAIAALVDCELKTLEVAIENLRIAGWIRKTAEDEFRLNWSRAV